MSVQLPVRWGAKEENFTVKVATKDHDPTKIAAVVNAAYKKVRYLQEGVQRATPREIADFIFSPNKRLYLCLSSKDEVCGTILVDFFEKNKAEIGLFAIHPDYQKYKIGPNFMSCVEQETFKKVNTVILKVIPLSQGNLIRFYGRLGYKFTGETKEFPAEDKLRYVKPDYRNEVFFCNMEKNLIRSSL